MSVNRKSAFEFWISEISIHKAAFLMYSVVTPWGEDDKIVSKFQTDAFGETQSLALWSFLVETAPSRPVFLDIGAHSGLYALLAAALRSDSVTIAFEPAAVTFGRLVHNVQINELNRQVIPAHLAAWNSETLMKLPHKYGLYDLCPGESLLRSSEPDHTESVLAVPLDSLISGPLPDFVNTHTHNDLFNRDVVAIKIDVEKAEIPVVEGAQELILKHRPTIICEALGTEFSADLVSILRDLDYVLIDTLDKWNMVFTPREKRDAFRTAFTEWRMANVAAVSIRRFQTNTGFQF